MKCVGCGNEINAESKFCKYCGTSVQQSIEAANSKKTWNKCPVCGAKVKPGNTFCTTCGTLLNEGKSAEHERKTERTKKKKKGSKFVKIFLAFTLLAAAALIAVVVLYFTGNNNDNRNRNTDGIENESTEDELSLSEIPEETVDITESEDTEDSSGQNQSDLIDVEENVELIREQYNNIVSSISSGAYTVIYPDTGIAAYYDGSDLKAIIAAKGSGNSEYSRSFYYDGDKLIFAYYEGSDSHRFYFMNDQLIRWRYSIDTSDSQNAVNYDLESTSQYLNWESSVYQDAVDLKNDGESALANGSSAREYILEGSDSRYISESELDALTKEEVKLARNEIYARNGRKFDDEQMRNYFSQFDWYQPTIDPDDFQESMLNKYEIANRDLIVQYEKDHGYR